LAGVLKALAATGQPVLVYMPHAPEDLRALYTAGNLRITDQPLDLMQTAKLCDLGVSHGGHNIAGTLMWHGKPQLIIPTVFPERVTGEKIAALGAGVVCPAEASALAAALTQVQQPGIAAKAQECAARISGMSMEAGLKGFMAEVERLAKAGPRK
jgi:UDP:flavonoid glycosyltransferase YjiC (YdhE family)